MNEEDIEAIREKAKNLACEYIERGDATGWFEALYTNAGGDNEQIPWADLEPNRFLAEWAESVILKGNGRKALVVGCGLGDDAKFLYDLGFKVIAFDVSPKAIEWAQKIHSDTDIIFHTADLFNPPGEWHRAFEFVLEVYTIQALPLSLRKKAVTAISGFAAEKGDLIVVTRGRENDQEPEGLPWAMSPEDLSGFERNGLVRIDLTELYGDEEEPILRYVAEFKRPSLK